MLNYDALDETQAQRDAKKKRFEEKIKKIVERLKEINGRGAIEKYLHRKSKVARHDLRNIIHQMFSEKPYGLESKFVNMPPAKVAAFINLTILSGQMEKILEKQTPEFRLALIHQMDKLERYEKIFKIRGIGTSAVKAFAPHCKTAIKLSAAFAGVVAIGGIAYTTLSTDRGVDPSKPHILASETNYTHYVSTQEGQLTVRKEPSEKSPVIASINKGQCVKVESRILLGFLQVAGENDRQKGYASADYLRKIPSGFRCPK